MPQFSKEIATLRPDYYNAPYHGFEEPSGPSPLKDFPTDILACVIDELRDDRRTLLACSLVSKSWLHLARRTFFHTVTLNSENRAKRLYQLLTNNPRLAQYVQVLVVSATNHAMQKKKTNDLQAWITTFLPHFASKLPHVGSLHFEDVQWNTLAQGLSPSFRANLSLFRAVKDLEFSGCKFETFQDFEAIVWSFASSVNRLTLRSMVWFQPDAAPTSYQLPLQTLRVISGCSLEMVHVWLTRLQAGRPHGLLRNLEFNEVHDTDFAHLGSILREIGPNLQSLKLGVQVKVEQRKLDQKRQDVGRWIPLQDNLWLRYLTIRVISSVPDHMRWIQNLLRLVNENSLLVLTFEVWLGQPSQVANNVWEDISWLVSETPRYASLQQVRFIHHGSLDIDVARCDIQRQFHRLHSCGKLTIENRRNIALFA